jgi:hypothetical protein
MQRQKIIRVEGRHGRDNPLPIETPQSRICLMGTPAGGMWAKPRTSPPLAFIAIPNPARNQD